jgi:protein-disulfide isomerase
MTSRTAQRRESARRTELAVAQAANDAAARRRRGRAGLVAIVIAGFVVAAAIVSASGGGPATAANPARVAGAAYSHALLAGIPQQGLVLGSAAAPVRMVEFADLQCPYCDQFATQALPPLITHYVRPGKVSIEFRNLSFIGAGSVRAGLAAAGAEQQNRLWNFVDLMYLNQGEENSGYVTNTYLHRLLAAIPGLDVARAERASRTPQATAVLGAANAEASANGINATPSFLVGRVAGALRVFQPDSLTAGPFAHEFDSLLAGR